MDKKHLGSIVIRWVGIIIALRTFFFTLPVLIHPHLDQNTRLDPANERIFMAITIVASLYVLWGIIPLLSSYGKRERRA